MIDCNIEKLEVFDGLCVNVDFCCVVVWIEDVEVMLKVLVMKSFDVLLVLIVVDFNVLCVDVKVLLDVINMILNVFCKRIVW